MIPTPILQRLQERRSVTPSGCWIYTGKARSGTRYGSIRHEGGVWLVHRLAYILYVGPIPPRVNVCHRCDEPLCFNPEHLYLGAPSGGHTIPIHTPSAGGNFGEAHNFAKLTEQKVRAIRRRRLEGEELKKLAAEYGVSVQAVYNAVRRETWKHVR